MENLDQAQKKMPYPGRQRPEGMTLRQLLSYGSAVLAVFVGLLEYLRMRILEVPEGLSLGGFDLISSALIHGASLTLAIVVTAIVLTIGVVVGVFLFAFLPMLVAGPGTLLIAIVLQLRWLGLSVVDRLAAVVQEVASKLRVAEDQTTDPSSKIDVERSDPTTGGDDSNGETESSSFLPQDEKTIEDLWSKFGVMARAVLTDFGAAARQFSNWSGTLNPRRGDGSGFGRASRRAIAVVALLLSFLAVVSSHARIMHDVGATSAEQLWLPIRTTVRVIGAALNCADIENPEGHSLCRPFNWFLPKPPIVYLRMQNRHGDAHTFLEVDQNGTQSLHPFQTGPYFYLGDFGEWVYLVAAGSTTPMVAHRSETPVDEAHGLEGESASKPREPATRQLFLRRSAISEFSLQAPPPTVEEDEYPAKELNLAIKTRPTVLTKMPLQATGADVTQFSSRLSAIEEDLARSSQAFDWRFQTLESDIRLGHYRLFGYLLDALANAEFARPHLPFEVVVQPVVLDMSNLSVSARNDNATGANAPLRPGLLFFGNPLHERWLETCTDATFVYRQAFDYLEGATLPDDPRLEEGITALVAALPDASESQGYSVFVVGSASFTGDPISNLEISEERAELVAEALARRLLGDLHGDPMLALERLRQNRNLSLYSYGVGELPNPTDRMEPRSVQVWVCATAVD